MHILCTYESLFSLMPFDSRRMSHWKCNVRMNPHVRLFICWAVGPCRSVCHNFLKGWEVPLPCFYRSTCLFMNQRVVFPKGVIDTSGSALLTIRNTYNMHTYIRHLYIRTNLQHTLSQITYVNKCSKIMYAKKGRQTYLLISQIGLYS